MKNFKLIIIAIVAFISLITLLIIPSHSAESEVNWRQSELHKALGNGEHYQLAQAQEVCAIIVYKNGTVRVSASDNSQADTSCFQDIIITKDGEQTGSIICEKKSSPQKDKKKGGDGNYSSIYVAKCRPHIKALPPEIQKRLANIK